jgi:hypothetical protein
MEGEKPEDEGLHHGAHCTAVVLPPENAVLFTPAPTMRSGLTDGVVTYCLPKDKPAFVHSVSEAFHGWEKRKQRR